MILSSKMFFLPTLNFFHYNVAFDNGDSDLFFDFDIGSPDQIEEIEDARIINLSIEDKDENQAEVISDGKLLVSSNSPTILETCTNESRPCHSDSTTEPSTAYGSTSSGLYCDSDSRGAKEILWLKPKNFSY